MQVKCVKIDMFGRVLAEYASFSEAARKNFMDRHCVSERCMRRILKEFEAGGFSFRIAGDEEVGYPQPVTKMKDHPCADCGGNVETAQAKYCPKCRARRQKERWNTRRS